MKKLLALLLALVMVLAMVGCSSGTKDNDNSSSVTVNAGDNTLNTDTEATWDTSKQDEIVLSVMNNYYTSGWEKMAEEYMKLHPETTVTIDVVADNDTLIQKFATWFASDDLTDAADITHINFSGNVGGTDGLLQKNQIVDFTSLLDTVNPYTGTTVRSYLEDADIQSYTGSYGMYALPFDHVAVAIMVNKTLLEKNNLSVPTTMEEFIDCCAKLKEAGIETPILATPEGAYFISALGDAAMRDMYGDFLVQTTDGLYNEDTMAANATYKYDPNNPACDKDIKLSGERIAIYNTENDFNTEIGKSIWTEYAKLAPYFNENFMASSSTEVLSSFELQNGAFLISGSWNVGVLNSDVQEMGDDGFEWETIAFPSYATKPEGWATGKIRSLYVMGNTMGIIKTHGDDEDHLNRVIDFYLYCYNPVGCATMYETTLNDGYFVQGNAAIKGVELPADIAAKLEGFIQEAPMRSDLDSTYGKEYCMSEDKGTYMDALNKLASGEVSVDEFVEILRPLCRTKLADDIEMNGYDMDPATKDQMK